MRAGRRDVDIVLLVRDEEVELAQDPHAEDQLGLLVTAHDFAFVVRHQDDVRIIHGDTLQRQHLERVSAIVFFQRCRIDLE